MTRMKISNSLLLAITVMVIIAVNSFWNGMYRESWLSPDSVAYLRMAQNIQAGFLMNPDGLAGFNDGWFSTWPIGYPMLIAGVATCFQVDVVVASKLVPILITGLILITFWLHYKSIFPVLAIGLINVAYLKIFRSSWSEQPFILLMLLFALVCERFRGGKPPVRERNPVEFVTTMFSGIAVVLGLFLLRYIGVFVFAVLGLILLNDVRKHYIFYKREGMRGQLRGKHVFLRYAGYGAIIAISGAFISGYLLMNYSQTESLTGIRPIANESVWMLFAQFTGAALREMQAWVLPVVLLFFVKRVPAVHDDVLLQNENRRKWQLLALTGVIYLAILFGLRCFSTFDDFGFRLLYPGSFMIFIGSVVWFSNNSKMNPMEWFNRQSRFTVVGLLIGLSVFGILAQDLESGVRKIVGKDPLIMPKAYRVVRAELEHQYKDIPKESLLIVAGYTTVDYWVSFIRPDIVVIPCGTRKYRESDRGLDRYSGIFITDNVPESFANRLGRGYTRIKAVFPLESGGLAVEHGSAIGVER